jgi:predicted aconitase with swiveling domain
MFRGGIEIMKLTGRKIFKGKISGEALVSTDSISFYGGVDPDSGVIVEKGHDLEGKSINDKILVFPSGKGSTVGSYVIYQMSKTGKGPKAMILHDCEAIVAVGAIISELPCIDQIDVTKIETGMQLEVDGDNGSVEIK